MIRRWLESWLRRTERKVGASLEEFRFLLRHAPGWFLRLVCLIPISARRTVLPVDGFHVVRLVAVMAEDCGGCVQAEVNIARQAGVDKAVLQAVLDQRPGKLSAELSDLFYFADAVVHATNQEAEVRERIRKRYGDRGLAELAMVIAVRRVFPQVKRALGFLTSCSHVKVDLQ